MHARRILLGSVLMLTSFVLAHPTHAAGNTYYVFADDESASDSNSCQLVTDPCLTLTGVIAKVEASIDPSDATIYARGTFHEQVDMNHIDMSGLTLTAYDTDNKPVIDATGYDHGMVFSSSLRDITFSHFEIVGPDQYGVAILGDGYTHAQNIAFRDLYIHDFGTSSYNQYGVYVVGADHVVLNNIRIDGMGSDAINTVNVRGVYVNASDYFTMKNSSVKNVHASYVDEETGAFSSSLLGVYMTYVNHFTILNNEFSDFVSSPELGTTGSLYPGVAAVLLDTNQNGVIRGNTMSDFTVNAVDHGTGSNGYANIYGVSATSQNHLVFRGNTLKNFSSSFTTDSGAGQTDVYALSISGYADLTIRGNAISHFASTTQNDSGTAVLYVFDIANVARPIIRNNTISDMQAQGVTGGAFNTVVRLNNTSDIRIYHNKIADFGASAESGTVTTNGIDLGYNAYGDVFNNALYSTDLSATTSAYAIHVRSKQTSPLNIVHNTISGLSSCLYLEDAQDMIFMNNICYLVSTLSQAVILDTAKVDMSTVHSDYNSFYSTGGIVLFDDVAAGIMNFSDWQTGDYMQDAHSITEDPQLRLADSTARRYLHLKKTSPVIGMGATEITMSDAAMQKLVKKDWDGQRRLGKGHVPDIGFDQYHQ